MPRSAEKLRMYPSTPPTSAVVPAPRARLVRRALETMPGSVVARRYHVTAIIGEGGMGSVYEAVDSETGSVVALKVIPPGASDAIRVKRLRREASAMTAVRSEHVCRVHYLGVENGAPFIVMERLNGSTLRSRLESEGALLLGEAVAITCQLLDALTATHDAGLIHRDVKPSNVFLVAQPGAAPVAKLIDFGLAKQLVPSEGNKAFDGDITATETIAGTLHYLAPEQLLPVGDIDERVDVYAAAVTLFEMLTGERPYQGTYGQIVQQIVLEQPPKPTDVDPTIPAIFDDVLATALAKDRSARFASARAFKTALLAALATVPPGYDRDRARQRLRASGVRQRCLGLDDHTTDVDPPTLRPPPMPVDVEGDREDDLPTLRPPPPGSFEGST